MINLDEFESRDDLVVAATSLIADALKNDIEKTGKASFAGAGGGTPKPVYEALSNDASISWKDVTVTLSDERRDAVAAGKDNTSMLKAALLKNAATEATFAELDSETAMDDMPESFSVIMLGMGTDGHFASIFPEGDGMAQALTTSNRVIGTTPSPLPPEAPFSRWTFSLDYIKKATVVLLLVSGDEKRAVLDRASSDGPVQELPVRALLRDADIPLKIFWAA